MGHYNSKLLISKVHFPAPMSSARSGNTQQKRASAPAPALAAYKTGRNKIVVYFTLSSNCVSKPLVQTRHVSAAREGDVKHAAGLLLQDDPKFRQGLALRKPQARLKHFVDACASKRYDEAGGRHIAWPLHLWCLLMRGVDIAVVSTQRLLARTAQHFGTVTAVRWPLYNRGY